LTVVTALSPLAILLAILQAILLAMLLAMLLSAAGQG
jgi:hypothetical protein